MSSSATIKDYNQVRDLKKLDGIRIYDGSYTGSPGEFRVVIIDDVLKNHVEEITGPINWKENG